MAEIFEKLGLLYLGKRADPSSQAVTPAEEKRRPGPMVRPALASLLALGHRGG